jgi:ATP-dependent exoDNAse (exonuclease V) beta subunit
MVEFDSDTHTYTNTETNRKYISVTTLLGNFKQEFDKEKHAARVAAREGVPLQMVLDDWMIQNKKATDRGTKIHKLMEDFILTDKILPGFEELYNSFINCVNINIGKYESVDSEKLLFNHTYEIAGTADLVYTKKKGFIIGDFKTNKKISFYSQYNSFYKEPVSHLSECEFNGYALQLSLYAYMHEIITNTKCLGLVIFYLQNKTWIPIHCNYLKSEICNILKYYRLNSCITNEKRSSD